MNKLFLASLLFLAISVGIASPEGKQEQTKANGPQELTLWTWVEGHQRFYQDAAQRWNNANPGRPLKLNAEVFPYDDMHNKLLIAIQSGVGAPDISDVEIQKFGLFMKGEIPFAELNDILNPVLDKMIKGRLDIYSKNGKYYGIDMHAGTDLMYYNMDIMKSAGIDVNQIETWDDFVKAGVKVSAIKPMTSLETSDIWTYWPLISQQRSDIFTANGDVILDNDTNIKTLQFLLDMLDKSKIAVTAPGGNHTSETFYAFYSSSEVGCIWYPMWWKLRLVDYVPSLNQKLMLRPLPRWTKDGSRSAGMGGAASVVLKQSKKVSLAKEFVAYAKLTKESNIQIYKILGFDPPRWDVWNDPLLRQPDKYSNYFLNGTKYPDMAVELAKEIGPLAITDKTPQAAELLKTQVLYQVLQTKTKTPAAALKEAADELRK